MSKRNIKQNLDQKLSLSPQQLIQANILQLNSIMLEARLYKELESNPALEIIEPPNNEPSLNDEKADLEQEDNLEDEENNYWEPKSSGADNSDIMSNISNQSTIIEQVTSALTDDNFTDEELKISEHIIGNLDEQGYLIIDSELISDRLNISNKLLQDIIEKIKHSKFPGLASSNIRECLLAQLIVYNVSPFAAEILENHFDDFMNKRYEKIIKNTSYTKEELQEAITVISQLNPNPRAMIDETDYKKQTIIPDLVIDKINDKWNIVVNNGSCPDLIISENYLKMFENKTKKKDVKNFLKAKIQSAQWFLEAINARNKTMQKIMASIIIKQNVYFNSNQKELKPMILKDIAEDVNMDISTISRATKEKYVQMPWGLKELKYFFSEGLRSNKGEISSKNVKQRISEIITQENKIKPLGDQEITDILTNSGIEIARRTVSKYREELNYQTARLRKEL